LAAKWKWRRQYPLARLAGSIEAIGGRGRKLAEESARMDRLRTDCALGLYHVCRPHIMMASPIDSRSACGEGFRGLNSPPPKDSGQPRNFGGRIFLQGAIRSFNRGLLVRNTLDEQTVFYCRADRESDWYYFDCRTCSTGSVTPDFLPGEMRRLI
jgi:hypothetical protein